MFDDSSTVQRVFSKIQQIGFQLMLISLIYAFIDNIWISIIVGLALFWTMVIFHVPDIIVAIMPIVLVVINIIQLFFIPFEPRFVIILGLAVIIYLTGLIGIIAVFKHRQRQSSFIQMINRTERIRKNMERQDKWR